MRPLVVVESLFVAAFVAVAGWATLRPSGQLPELRAEALATGPSEERWMGIFQGGAHIGYSMSREAATADGGRVYTEQAVFSLGSMGTVSRVVLGGSAVVGADGALRQVEAFSSSPVVALVRGEVQEGRIHLEVSQGASTSVIDVPIDEPPKVAATLSSELRGAGLAPGKTISVPYFDPMRQVSTTATLVVESAETLASGEVGYWVRGEFGGMEVRRLVDGETGETIREEGAMGLTLQRMTKEDAMAVDAGPPPDMVALAAVPIDGTIDESRPLHVVAVRVRGVPARKFADDPPLQAIDQDVVRVSVPLLAELPTLPVAGEGDTEATPSIPAADPEIIDRARAVVGDAPDRLEAVRRLHRFVYEYVDKVPTIGVPNGLDVLHEKRGDCNEHTALFVSLARAVGIPSRIAAGLVYSSRTGGPPAFYYHAWPEVRLGGPTEWVPIDPTLDQLPADATHLKIVNGDLDRQVEIMGLIGKVGLSLVEAR